MDPFSAIVLAGTGVFVYRALTKKSGGGDSSHWRRAVEEAATKLDGKASFGASNAPELRATVDQVLVNLRLEQIDRAREDGVAIAESRVTGPAEKIRLYIGWDIGSVKNEVAHIPQLHVVQPFGVEGRIMLRSDHPEIAKRFLRHALNDLTDVRREAVASALELKLTGGTLRLAVHGIQQSSWMVERIIIATTRLVRGIVYFAEAGDDVEDLPSMPMEPAEAIECALCTSARKRDEAWVRCDRCDAAYHRRCWVQATGCLADDCHETRATPM